MTAQALRRPTSRAAEPTNAAAHAASSADRQKATGGHSRCSSAQISDKLYSDCLAAKLRPGNVHSVDGWEDMLLPEIERQQGLGKEVVFRADAAFAKPEIYEALEERGVKYAIRIPSNDSLERDIS